MQISFSFGYPRAYIERQTRMLDRVQCVTRLAYQDRVERATLTIDNCGSTGRKTGMKFIFSAVNVIASGKAGPFIEYLLAEAARREIESVKYKRSAESARTGSALPLPAHDHQLRQVVDPHQLDSYRPYVWRL